MIVGFYRPDGSGKSVDSTFVATKDQINVGAHNLELATNAAQHHVNGVYFLDIDPKRVTTCKANDYTWISSGDVFSSCEDEYHRADFTCYLWCTICTPQVQGIRSLSPLAFPTYTHQVQGFGSVSGSLCPLVLGECNGVTDFRLNTSRFPPAALTTTT